jgi:biopolymer transport protein ExbD
MAKFKRSGKGGQPAISTASLPDIVFMLLFFFMVTTVMRETSLMVKVTVPKATEVRKLENKSLVSYIYVGAPQPAFRSMYGDKPRIQLNDKISEVDEVMEFVYNERADRPEPDRPKVRFSIKADETVKMGIITDIKTQLRKSSALRINYSSKKVESYDF